MKEKLISIIIPMYNAEKYITECIDSILEQKYKNFEIVIIDDGSSDNSIHICEKLREKDERIVIYKQINKGVSCARNKGLEMARGEYICFVDSDDVVSKEYLNTLFQMICYKDVDCAIVGSCSLIEEFEQGENTLTLFEGKEEILRELHDGRNYHGQVWGKLFKKSLVGDIKFNSTFYINEDMAFVQEYFLKSKRVYLCKKKYYFYRINSQSAINIKYCKKDNTARDASLYMLREIENCCPSVRMYAIKSLICSDLYILDKMIISENIDHNLAQKINCELRSVSNKKIIKYLTETTEIKVLSFYLLLINYHIKILMNKIKKITVLFKNKIE